MASRDSQHEQPQKHDEPENDDKSFDMVALHQFDYIRFTVTDMNGVGRSIAVPRRHVDHCLRDGMTFISGTPPTSQIRHLANTKHLNRRVCLFASRLSEQNTAF